jgi:hypothetical protein
MPLLGDSNSVTCSWCAASLRSPNSFGRLSERSSAVSLTPRNRKHRRKSWLIEQAQDPERRTFRIRNWRGWMGIKPTQDASAAPRKRL